ncbi:hypothetical protein [Tissierella praeacuta]|uniref:hypothetical protein n=1 Tax=Tissierella praeacuta TaxID=43131 RepID=UPI0033429EDA
MLKKNVKKHLSVVLSVLMLLAILPLNVIAVEEHEQDGISLRSFGCDYCGEGQIVSRKKVVSNYLVGVEQCGHSSKCKIEERYITTQTWTQCTTYGCYHSGVDTQHETKYIHTSCGR